MRKSVATLLLVWPVFTAAHHSTATYNRQTVVEMEAELLSVSWRNPHTRFTVSVAAPDGGELWELDGTAFYLLERAGVTKDLFTEGTAVTVAGYPSSIQPQLLQVTNMLLNDGTEVLIWGTEPRWQDEYRGGPGKWITDLEHSAEPPAGDRDIFKVWSAEDLALFIHLNEGMELPLTDAVIARFDELDVLDPCIPPGMPSSMATPLPIQFIRVGNTIELWLSAFDAIRVIHLTDETLDADGPPQLQGNSTGRWNGDTLEVRTERVSWPYFDDGAIPQTEAVDIVERFTLNEDATRLAYEMVVTEPATFTEPVTLEWSWVAIGEQLSPLNCIDGG